MAISFAFCFRISRSSPNNLIANSSADNDHAVRLAMASLMVEVAESDYHDAPEEHESLLNIVKNRIESELDKIKKEDRNAK